MLKSRCLPIFLFAIAGATLQPALAADPRPGIYVLSGGNGRLEITGTKKRHFVLNTYGPAMQVCELSGRIKNGRGRVKGGQRGDPVCTVRFDAEEDGFQVTGAPLSACRNFCGARVHFEGLFKPFPASCTAKAVDATLRRSADLDARGSGQEAIPLIEQLLDTCRDTLSALTAGQAMQQLAATHRNQGKFDACEDALQPLARDIAESDEDLRMRGSNLVSLVDIDRWLPVIDAARKTLDTCRQNSGWSPAKRQALQTALAPLCQPPLDTERNQQRVDLLFHLADVSKHWHSSRIQQELRQSFLRGLPLPNEYEDPETRSLTMAERFPFTLSLLAQCGRLPPRPPATPADLAARLSRNLAQLPPTLSAARGAHSLTPLLAPIARFVRTFGDEQARITADILLAEIEAATADHPNR